MAATSSPAPALKPIDSLVAEVITDDVSDTYVSKTLFAVSEFSNVVLAGAKVISGEALLCANLGFGLKLVSQAENVRHTLLFDTGPEGAIFIRNCANLGIRLGEVECIAVSHGHWDHMAALPHAVEAIMKDRRPRRRACQSRNVQRTRHPAQERHGHPGRQRSAPG